MALGNSIFYQLNGDHSADSALICHGFCIVSALSASS